MGNDHSHLAGINIEEKSVEVSDFWSHHSAAVVNSESTTNLSVLLGELFVDGPLWKTHTPLEKTSKHLMIYRHPCILKYISSWHKNSKFYLAVEEVAPLAHVLASQNTLQICMGLHSILKALCFLHDKASVSHNNICTAAVYVTKSGSWKLGGMEYVCKFSDLTSEYLKKSRNNRYSKAIDPNEEKHVLNSPRKDFIDTFAYGVLAGEVLKSRPEDDILSLASFRDLCANELQNVDVSARPKLTSLLQHEFFNHEFIVIHSFLIELPLKSDESKTQFFLTLAERLRKFPENTVASQLGSLLLSRLVLLNKTAQDMVLPYILCPKEETDDDMNFFSEETFRRYIVPKLLEIFCVRDAQIRLLLLNYFKHFVEIFTKEELQTCILPELLVGVKDTNDHLVSVTLRTLAELVPLLGAATVIGGKRGRLFTDGRPTAQSGRRSRKSFKKHEAVAVASPLPENVVEPSANGGAQTSLPERPRPDGEEGETSTEEAEQSVEEDLDNWEDWGESNLATHDNAESSSVRTNSSDSVASVVERSNEEATEDPTRNHNVVDAKKKSLIDISELDIKNQTTSGLNDEFDFFQDMEPVIETTSKYLIKEDVATNLTSKLNLTVNEEGNEDGWVDEDW